MSRFTKPFSTILAVMLISVLAMGQSFQTDDSPSLQKMQEQLTQDIQPGVVPVTLTESDFDYKKIVTSNKEKEVLWDNGGLITIPGGGSGGSDYSELQDASLGMSTYGAGFQISAGNSVADEFTVDGSWTIESFTFYGYQTGSGPPSTLNAVRFQIWDGSPMAGGTVIFGDLTTNVMLSTTWTNIWRVLESAPAENRPIMEIVADASGLVLSAGTYWVQWQVGGTGTSGPWAPPVTIVGEPTTGNALQNTSTGWAAFVDGGSLTPNGFPFIINGSTGPQAENDLGITQIISPVSGFDLGMEPVTVRISNFGTNDQSGFDVNFTLDGGTTVTETVSVTVMANSTYDYTFAATADLSAYGDYMIEACTMLASDEDLSNDCLSETVTNSDPNPPGECEDFDALNPGDYVAGELGGLWTTWSGQPGTAEDAVVSDMYSVSPSNSILIEGTTDLFQLFNAATITTGVYEFSNNIYVPTGKTGYWNLQKDVIPGITEGWGIQMMYDDDGMIHIDAGADDAVVIPYSYDTWYFNEIIVDLDNDLCEFYIDGNLISQHQWTLGTFGNVGPNTLGGCNYYANPGTGGTPPGAFFDDVCFSGDIPEPPAPPTNLTGPDMVSAGNDIVLNWWAPGSGSGEDFFEGFEGGTLPTGWLAIDNDGDGYNWENTIEQGFGFDAYEGTGAMTSASYDNTAGALTPDNYLITPAIQIGASSELSYFHDAQDPAWASDFYYVRLSTTGTALSDFTEILWSGTTPVDWTEVTIDLSAYAGNTCYFAFHHTECTDWFWMKIDNFTITSTESKAKFTPTVEAPANQGMPFRTSGMTEDEIMDTYANYDANKSTKALIGYNVYRAMNSGSPALLDFTELTTYTDNVGVTGVYTYCVTAVYDEEGESDCSNDHIVDVITGIDQHLATATNLYPNPATDAVTVKSDYTIKSVQVYNFAGQIVLSETTNNTMYRVNTSNLNTGIYLFQIETENGRISKRIVIE